MFKTPFLMTIVDESEAASGGSDTDTDAANAANAGGEGSGNQSDKGSENENTDAAKFPANTPFKDMKPEEQIAYALHNSRKHEDRVKALNAAFGSDLTPDIIAELKNRTTEHETALETLRTEHATTLSQAIETAKSEARAEALGTVAPTLVSAEFKAAAAGRVSAEQLAPFLSVLDHSKFLNEDGTVNAELVQSNVDALFPTNSTSTSHGGYRPINNGVSSVDAGRELFRSTHKTRTNS